MYNPTRVVPGMRDPGTVQEPPAGPIALPAAPPGPGPGEELPAVPGEPSVPRAPPAPPVPPDPCDGGFPPAAAWFTYPAPTPPFPPIAVPVL